MNTIQASVPTVLAYILTTYGTIDPEALMERKLKVCEKSYDLMEPLVTIYNEIEELEHFGVAVINPYSQSQIVNYGLTIIKNTNNFETGIRTWITRPLTKHMWPNFKTHFEEAHCVLMAVRGMTMRSSAYHHSNILASQVLSEVKNVHDNILQGLESHTTQIKMEAEIAPSHPQSQAVNAMTLDTVLLKMLRVSQ